MLTFSLSFKLWKFCTAKWRLSAATTKLPVSNPPPAVAIFLDRGPIPDSATADNQFRCAALTISYSRRSPLTSSVPAEAATLLEAVFVALLAGIYIATSRDWASES